MSIKLVEDYSVIRKRNYTRESLQNHGEQCVLLSMWHPADGAAQCPNCADDIYGGGSNDCNICFGSGFNGGVKSAQRVWALFSDHQVGENYSQRGTWTPDSREMQTEAFPQLIEHDYVVRVRVWDLNGIPVELEGYYGIQAVTRESLRTGNRFGQFYWDITGQRATVTKLQANVAINRYPILGQTFPEVSWSTNTPVIPIPQPDQRVIVYPPNSEFVALVGDGAKTVFTLTHNLNSRDITVVTHDAATGEEVEPDVFADPDGIHVTLDFGEPPALNQYRVGVKR